MPADTHKKIIDPAGTCGEAANSDSAKEFLDWAFTNEEAIKVWQEGGLELAA